MYNKFFGFKEKPFKLVPNPAYFYLSKSHEEALAHLNYAISQGDGFVEITGEVGTGKTTLCRAFLEGLNRDTEAAYIFNPKMGPQQLLQTINDEFGLASDCSTIKELIDHLNAFLMQKKALGKKVVLLIDEAQNLTHNVLEQLRLLSNLETNHDKLLQIILVGQPELREMLDSRELRQIGQRITLSYHLIPLGFKETKGYIQHRINKATRKKGIKFESAALRHVYQYSGGIPRLINIVCERALLTAYVLNHKKITGSVTKAAMRELAHRTLSQTSGPASRRKPIALLAALGVIFWLVISYRPVITDLTKLVEAPKPRRPAVAYPNRSQVPVAKAPSTAIPDTPRPQAMPPDLSPSVPAVSVTEAKPPHDLAVYLKSMDTVGSRNRAFKLIMGLWQSAAALKPYLNDIADDEIFFRMGAKLKGFQVKLIESDLDLITRLNLPAILKFSPLNDQSPGFLTLSAVNDGRIILWGGDGSDVIHTDWNEIKLYWSGMAYMPWKNFLALQGTISKWSTRDSIATLKVFLHDLGHTQVTLDDVYDATTQTVIKTVQAKYGVPADGLVGPLTKIILYREKAAFKMPALTQDRLSPN